MNYILQIFTFCVCVCVNFLVFIAFDVLTYTLL